MLLGTKTTGKDISRENLIALKALELLLVNDEAAVLAFTNGRLQTTLNFLVKQFADLAAEDEDYVKSLLRV